MDERVSLHLFEAFGGETLRGKIAAAWLERWADDWFAADPGNHVEVHIDRVRVFDEVATTAAGVRSLIDRSLAAASK